MPDPRAHLFFDYFFFLLLLCSLTAVSPPLALYQVTPLFPRSHRSICFFFNVFFQILYPFLLQAFYRASTPYPRKGESTFFCCRPPLGWLDRRGPRILLACWLHETRAKITLCCACSNRVIKDPSVGAFHQPSTSNQRLMAARLRRSSKTATPQNNIASLAFGNNH